MTLIRHGFLEAGLLYVATTTCSYAADSSGMQIGGSAGVLIGGVIGSGMTAGSIAGTLVGAATGGVLGSSLGLLS
jgi:hypothetical protein